MANPFEDDEESYSALINSEGQYSLWPHRIEIPAGWSVAFGPVARDGALAHIEEYWEEMRPSSPARLLNET